MAFRAKWTAQRGKNKPEQVALSAGTAEAQTDTISINIDQTKLARGDAIVLLNDMINAIARAKWPPL